jgi:hypothetical protein
MLQVDPKERSTFGETCVSLRKAIARTGARINPINDFAVDYPAGSTFTIGSSVRASNSQFLPRSAAELGLRQISTDTQAGVFASHVTEGSTPYNIRASIPGTPMDSAASEISHFSGLTLKRRLAVNPFQKYPDESKVIPRRYVPCILSWNYLNWHRQLEFSHLANDFQRGTVQITQSQDPEKGLRVVAQFDSGAWAPPETGELETFYTVCGNQTDIFRRTR